MTRLTALPKLRLTVMLCTKLLHWHIYHYTMNTQYYRIYGTTNTVQLVFVYVHSATAVSARQHKRSSRGHIRTRGYSMTTGPRRRATQNAGQRDIWFRRGSNSDTHFKSSCIGKSDPRVCFPNRQSQIYNRHQKIYHAAVNYSKSQIRCKFSPGEPS